MRHVILVGAALICVWLGAAAWAKSGLPTVEVVDHNGWKQLAKDGDASAWAVVGMYKTDDGFTSEFSLNMDGTWTIHPVHLFRVMAVAATLYPKSLSPKELGWRVLLAYPLLRTVSDKRAAYVASHPETWD